MIRVSKPLPPLIVKRHEGVAVVRDDLFPYGSKARFLDDYFASFAEREIVYGSSPRWGFAQISIAFLARRHGKKAILFLAKGELTQYSKRALELGAVIEQVPMGFLTVTEARAESYAVKTGARLLPLGLDCPEAIEGIVKWCGALEEPDEVWTVASSGTLTRGLQQAFKSAEFFSVQVGKELTQKSVGRAKIVESRIAFAKPAKELPPFPSVIEYDAKAWQHIPKDGKKRRLFWNVGA